jgi:hypothetical protein
MARYILIDSDSGYIWGDTIDCPSQADLAATPLDAARWLDGTLGEHGRTYEDVYRLDGRAGYLVYRADVDGSDAVGPVLDGQDRETIDAVTRDCEHVATIAYQATES